MRKVKRARTASGHFKKKAKRSAPRKNPVKRKRTAAKRPAKRRVHKRTAKRSVVRVKRALGRKKSNGRFTRRSKHRVRGFKRKVRGTRKKKLIRSHLSYERTAPKRRRRRARVEEEMKENPRRRKRRTKKARKSHRRAAMENPRPRKRRRARRASPRRRSATAIMPAVVRRRTRKGGRSTSPATVRVVIAGLGGRGRSKRRAGSKRRSPARKRKHARKKRKSSRSYTPRSHQLGTRPFDSLSAEAGLFANPLGGYALENPLSYGELALAGLTGTFGYVLADFLDRWLAVRQYAPTPAAGAAPVAGALSPSVAVLTQPGIMRILAQAALAAAPLALSYYATKPLARASLQGAGLGALFHLGGQIVNHFVLARFATSTHAPATMAQYYQNENQADTAATASGLSGLPGSAPKGLAAPRTGAPTRARVVARPSIPYKADPGPRALAAPAPTGVGDCGDPDPTDACDPCGGQTATQSAASSAAAATAATASPSLSGLAGLDWFSSAAE